MNQDVDCEYCGKRGVPTDNRCAHCKRSFDFLIKPQAEWEPWDYSAWLFAQHYILDARAQASGLDSLTEEQRAVVLVGALYYQVENGGLDQYLRNPTGAFSNATLTVLRQIDATELADALQATLELFPNGKPSGDEKVRWDQVTELDPVKFERLRDQVGDLVDRQGAGCLLRRLCDFVGSALVSWNL